MISPEQRQTILGQISQACAVGARLATDGALIGLSVRTMERSQHTAQDGDRRVDGNHRYTRPHSQFSAEERDAAPAVLNREAFKDMPPRHIVGWPGRQRTVHGI